MGNEIIHQELLTILKAIDQICSQENLSYMLNAGTLLGAVREKGFIAWDDDADLMMHRQDFEAFARSSPKYLPDLGLFLGYIGRVPMVARLDKPEIMVEIMILDTLPQSKWQQKNKIFRLKLMQGMMKKDIDYSTYDWKGKLLVGATALLGRVTSDEAKLEKYRQLSMLGNDQASDYVFFANERFRYMNLKIKRSMVDQTVRLPFVDTQLLAPVGWDAFLRLYYGDDYMIPKRDNYYA